MTKYYVVQSPELNLVLAGMDKRRQEVAKLRHEFAKKNFPGHENVHNHEGKLWRVGYPSDASGKTEIPPYMRWEGDHGGCVPMKKTAEGKRLAKEMEALDPMPGHGDLCDFIGLQRFQWYDGGLRTVSPGMQQITKGPYKSKHLLFIPGEAKFENKACIRVSDIEAEEIIAAEEKATKRKKPTKKRAKTK